MLSLYEDEDSWGRRTYIMVLLCQSMGPSSSMVLPSYAVMGGSAGYMITYILTFLFIGTPLLYMEFIVSQFTARDCIDVWKARRCFSYVGYILVILQVIIFINNHAITSFIVHYFLISFEYSIPYYYCGQWATKDCNILEFNYTTNQDCIKSKQPPPYCDSLYTTFPEYQYWRHYLLGMKKHHFHVAWRVCLASALVCFIMYISCFKRKQSVRWFAGVFTVYPAVGYIILMLGSMVQKGLVVMYEDALDLDFDMFTQKFRFSHVILQVIYTMGIGSGVNFNVGSKTSFRSPCYSNTVITVVICATFTTLVICTVTMMSCPYAYEYGIDPSNILAAHIDLTFEKIPRFLKEYSHKSFWLVLIFSSNAILSLSTNVMLYFNMLEMIITRCPRIGQYPGLLTFSGICVLFLSSISLLGFDGLGALMGFKSFVILVTILVAMLECLVFVLWYGLDRFAEDVHFMQGVQPKAYMKAAWVLLSILLGYVFVNEMYYQKVSSQNTLEVFVGWCTMWSTLGIFILVTSIKLIIGVVRKRFMDVIRLDPGWGPKCEVLQRSRAMFTAQAMTKEYMYRQYHLQAGILARQKRSNTRRVCGE